MYNTIILTEKKNKLQKLTEEVDDKAENLGNEAALADKYATLTSETPYYEGFNAILLNLPNELRSTAEFWRNTAKKDLQSSLTSIRSFTSTYTSYFPDLIKEILTGAETVAAKREMMLQYLEEVRPKLNSSIINLKNTQDTSKEFLTQVENQKDKLETRVLPNIQNAITEKKSEIAANDEILKECRAKINQLDKQRMAAISATIGTASTLPLGGAFLGVEATALYFKTTTKIAGGSAAEFTGKFAKNVGSKLAAGAAAVFVVINVVAFITSSALWSRYQKELAELRAKELKYFQTSMELNADAGYLNHMEKNFAEVLQQGSEVVIAFQGLQNKWKGIQLEIDQVNSKLKDLGTSLNDKPAVDQIEQNLKDLDKGFSALEKRLKDYELEFVLPAKFVEDPKEVTATDNSRVLLRGPATPWMPSALYAAYSRVNNRFN